MSRVSAAESALVIVDVQQAALAMVGSAPAADILANVVALVRVARVLAMPVMLAEAPFPGPGAARPAPLADVLPDPTLIPHAANDAWPMIRPALEKAGRTAIVLAGIATDVGVGLAALSARADSWPVLVAADACGTTDHRAESAAWLRLAHAGVGLASWSAIAAELAGTYTSAQGQQVLAIVRDRA